MSDLFGAPSGFQAYQRDQAELAVQGSVAALHAANAAKAQIEAKRAALMYQVLSSGVPGGPGEQEAARPDPNFRGPMPAQQVPLGVVGNTLDAVAQNTTNQALLLQRAGFAKEGADLGAKVATMRMNASRANNFDATTALHQVDTQRKILEERDALLSGVTDAYSFQNAQMAYLQSHPGAGLPPQLQQYDPGVVEALRRSTKQGLDNLKFEEQKIRDKATADNRQQANDLRQDRNDIAREAVRIREEALQRAKKSSGTAQKPVGFPTTGEQTRAVQAVKEAYPDLEGSDLDNFGFEVAAKAKYLLKNNAGLDAQTALDQAMTDPEIQSKIQPVATAFGMLADKGPMKSIRDVAKNLPGGSLITGTRQKYVRSGGASADFSSQNEDVLRQARDAIARGAPKDKVVERLNKMGVDSKGL